MKFVLDYVETEGKNENLSVSQLKLFVEGMNDFDDSEYYFTTIKSNDCTFNILQKKTKGISWNCNRPVKIIHNKNGNITIIFNKCKAECGEIYIF